MTEDGITKAQRTHSPPTIEELTEITGNSATAKQIYWLTAELNKGKVTDHHTLLRQNMIAEIRANMFRMTDVEKKYYRAINTLNGICHDITEFWKP